LEITKNGISLEKVARYTLVRGDLGDVQGSASRRRRSCCRAGEQPSSTIPRNDDDANQREAHGCAYCQGALQHSALLLFLGCLLTQSTFRPGKRFDEYEHSGVCLGSKRRRVDIWVTVRLQKLKQLSGRARFMCCLPHQTVKMHAQK
jgi:hypothetical protein